MRIKKSFYIFIVFTLLYTILYTIPTNTAFANTKFKDVPQSHWALQAIEEMHAAGIINGYPDGTFKPDAPVTRLHAIIMLIRANGLQDEAENYDLNNCTYDFPAGLNEDSKKYLAIAADKGWIVGSVMKNMQPNNPATREEVAVLIGISFDLKGDFEKLPFADKNSILENFRSYVAGLYEANIMKGRTDTMFYPRSQVKRSEMAAIFSRLSEQNKVNPSSFKRINGRIIKYNNAIKQLTVQTTDGFTEVLFFHTDASIYINNVKSSPVMLKSGQFIRLYLNQQNQIVFLKTIGKPANIPSSQSPVTEYNESVTDDKEYLGYAYELMPNKIKIKLLSDDYITFYLSENLALYDKNELPPKK